MEPKLTHPDVVSKQIQLTNNKNWLAKRYMALRKYQKDNNVQDDEYTRRIRAEIERVKKNIKELQKELYATKKAEKKLDSNITRYAKVIMRDCKPFLDEIDYEVGSYPMYRGLGRSIVPFMIKKARLRDRTPKDTDKMLHTLANRVFEKLFKHKYRNAVFVAGKKSIASDYGTPYAIFPIGEFEYLWSLEVNDFTEYFYGDDIFPYSPMDISAASAHSKKTMQNENYIALLNKINDLQYRTDNLKDAISSGNEIMIWCDKYYAVRVDYLDALADKILELKNGDNE